MKKLTKKALSALLAMLMLIGTMGTAAFAAEGAEELFTYGADDLVIADFSKADTSSDITYWRADDNYELAMGTRFRSKTEITDEVSLKEGGTSLKMDHRIYNVTDGVEAYYNTRIQRNFGLIVDAEDIPEEEKYPEDKQTKIFYTVEDVLSYDYLYMWIYSNVANNQVVNVQINDLETSMYSENIQIKMDYTGWKLHKINISGWELSSFDNTRDEQEATAALTDNIRFNMQSTGWSTTARSDTVIYVDSIWLSNETSVYTTDYDENDYLIGDFSSPGGAAAFGGGIQKDCSEVTRAGRATSVRVSPTDGNFRLTTPSAYRLGDILDRDNLYFWVYSSVANGQQMHVILFDETTKNGATFAYIQKKTTVVFDWVGWKRIKINKNDWNKEYSLSSFNNTQTDEATGEAVTKTAAADDIAYLWFSPSWGGVEKKADTKLYFDSIWFSDKDLIDTESFTPAANEWETDGGYLLADFSSETSNVAQWASLGSHKHADMITNEVARVGKTQSLKWPSTALGGTSRLRSPKIPLDTVKNYKYIYAWIYSNVANSQKTSFTLLYNGTNVINNMHLLINHTGWKLCRFDISSKTANIEAVESVSDCQPTFQYSGYGATELDNTLLYIDSIWLSNTDYYTDTTTELIKDFNGSSASVNGTFNTISGSRKAKKSSTVDTYGNSTYSAEVIPSEDSYTYATTTLYTNTTGMAMDSATLKDKYLNIIINAVNAENQQIRINFDGKKADGTTTRVYKIFSGIEPGWQVLSLPLAEFVAQNPSSSTPTEEILAATATLHSVDLHFPDWGNGRETIAYREITEGETGTHVYNAETKKYEAVSDGTGTHVYAEDYRYVSGNYYWDNIGSKISSDAKYYVDSIFLSDKDMSTAKLNALNTVVEEVVPETFTAVFEAPYKLTEGTDYYKNYVTVTKNGAAVAAEEYNVLTDGKFLVVKPVNGWDYSSEYEVEVSEELVMSNELTLTEGAAVKFTTLTKYPAVYAPMDVTGSGTVAFTAAETAASASTAVTTAPDSFVSLSARTVLNNTSKADVNVCMIVAVYDSNNQLAGMFKGGDTTIAAGEAGAVTTVVTGEFADCTAKAFLWDMSADAMIPYSAATPLN